MIPAGVTIRPCKPEDVERVLELWGAANINQTAGQAVAVERVSPLVEEGATLYTKLGKREDAVHFDIAVDCGPGRARG